MTVAVLALAVAGCGGESRAPAPPPPPKANLWIDTTGGRCARQATTAEYDDAQACGTSRTRTRSST